MILLKESAGDQAQYRAFSGMDAVRKFFGTSKGEGAPPELKFGEVRSIVWLDDTDISDKWQLVSVAQLTGNHHELIDAAHSGIKIPDVAMPDHTGMGDGFGRHQIYNPTL